MDCELPASPYFLAPDKVYLKPLVNMSANPGIGLPFHRLIGSSEAQANLRDFWIVGC